MQYNLFKALPNQIEGEGKNCTWCNQYLPLESFDWHSGFNTWRRPECKQCRGDSKRIRDEIRKHAPPISEDHTCPICEKSLEEISLHRSKSMGSFVLDHDHEKNIFRGWLCHCCNTAIGMLRDDPTTVMRAYKYLKEFKDEHS